MLGISREEQDLYGIASYKKAAAAYAEGNIKDELVQVEIKGKRGKPSTFVTEDEEYKKVNFDKFSKLATVFQKDGGTVTAGNASTLSDGAAATNGGSTVPVLGWRTAAVSADDEIADGDEPGTIWTELASSAEQSIKVNIIGTHT